MGKSKYYHYFVEGQDEEKLIKVLKSDLRVVVAGKIDVFNVVEKRLTKLRMMSFKPETTVILVFDTDTGNVDILKENIALLKKERYVNDVICVPQVCNLEDELKRSCDIRQIKELTGSRSNADYKHDMIRDTHFSKKLERHKFDIKKFWNTPSDNEYKEIPNDAKKIKQDAPI